MGEERTTAVVQGYLDELAGDQPAEPVIRALLERAVHRLHELCAALLHRSYPRLTRPPLNLQVEAARMLEVSVATVNRRMSRGLQLLAAELGDLYPNYEDPAKS